MMKVSFAPQAPPFPGLRLLGYLYSFNQIFISLIIGGGQCYTWLSFSNLFARLSPSYDIIPLSFAVALT